MGALACNRKRVDEHLSLNHHLNPHPDLHPYLRSSDFRSSKKFRFSSAPQGAEQSAKVSSKNFLSRIALYPESAPKLLRKVHAPCRVLKFGLGKSGCCRKLKPYSRLGKAQQQRQEDEDMGQFLGSLLKKDKEVIDVEDEPENAVASGDSSIEEVEVIEDVLEERFEVSGQVNVSETNLYKHGKTGKPLVQASTSSVKLRDGNLKLDNTGKLLNGLSLDQDKESSVAAYKNLLKTAERRSRKLDDLGFRIELNEKRLSAVRAHPVKKAEKQKAPSDAFVPLSKEEGDEVARALQSSNRRKVLVSHANSNIEITGELLQCLGPRAWLNDEVINVYLELLKERENREPKKFLKCHFFNTFFYKKLIGGRTGYDYKSVRRWTTQRKLGYSLFECDKIFVPIHKEIHWCLAVINKKDKKFQYLDSLKGRDSQVLKVLARYYVDEVKDKSGIDIDVRSWEQEYVEDLPEQENGYDCGVFMVKYADFYSRGLDLCFGQKHMPYFRLRTAKEILRLRAD